MIEIENEKNELQQLIKQAKQEKNELNRREEMYQNNSNYVKQHEFEFEYLIMKYNSLVHQHNEIYLNYVKRSEIANILNLENQRKFLNHMHMQS